VHRVPWVSILTAPCVWAIIVTHGASVFGFFTVVNQLPTYMKHILRFNIKEVNRCFGLQPVVCSFVDISLPVSSSFMILLFSLSFISYALFFFICFLILN
jgi:hypothetical protein